METTFALPQDSGIFFQNGLAGLDLGIEELEDVVAPGDGWFAAGVASGVVVGGAIWFFT